MEVYSADRYVPDFHRFGTDEVTLTEKVLMDLSVENEPTRVQLLGKFLPYIYNNMCLLVKLPNGTNVYKLHRNDWHFIIVITVRLPSTKSVRIYRRQSMC